MEVLNFILLGLAVTFGVGLWVEVRKREKRERELMLRYCRKHPDATPFDVMRLFDVDIEEVLEEVWGLAKAEVRELEERMTKELESKPGLEGPDWFEYGEKLMNELLAKRKDKQH